MPSELTVHGIKVPLQKAFRVNRLIAFPVSESRGQVMKRRISQTVIFILW
jgi:hypothetical protein